MGNLSMTAATLTVNAGANVTSGVAGLTFGDLTIGNNATPATLSASSNTLVTIGAATSGNNRSLVLTGVGNTVVNGTISLGTGGVTKSGEGKATLSGSNTYTGTTTISGGTLQFAQRAALYSGSTANWTAAKIIINSGATLALNVGGSEEFSSADVDTIKVIGTSTTGFRNGTILGLDTTNATGGDFNYATTIADTNSGTNSVGLTKLGGSMLTLSSSNTYTGATTISSGTLNAAATGALGQGAAGTSGITVNSGGTLLLSNTGVTDRAKNTAPVTLAGGVIAAATESREGEAATVTGGIVTGSSAVGLGLLTLSASSTLNFDELGNSTLMVFAGFAPGAFTLNIVGYTNLNFDGTLNSGSGTDDRLVFNQMLTGDQLSAINFGAGLTATQMLLDDGFYEIGVTPVPEPTTVLGALALVGAFGFRGCRRIKYLASRLFA